MTARLEDVELRVVDGVEGMSGDLGRLFVVVGVFDGLHRGHAYLLEHLRTEADRRRARPSVITFDHHPDEVLVGAAPPLLCDPAERLERLAATGVEVAVIQPFNAEVRRIEYDDFVRMIADRVELAGFLMTPDAAFGHERRGTPETLSELGGRMGFDVVVVAPFEIGGQTVRSSDIRAAIADGDLAAAERLLGRPYAVTGSVTAHGMMTFPMPVALPSSGLYEASISGRPVSAVVASDTTLTLRGAGVPEPGTGVRLEFR